jgi:hypothetical protein
MTYKVYPEFASLLAREFETYDDIIDYYWMTIISNRFNNYRIIDTYDHQLIDMDKFISYAWKKHNDYVSSYYNRKYGKKYKFRNGPVPGIHKHIRHKGSYIRHQRTFAEIREESWLSYDEDLKFYNIKSRPKRTSLPDPWDDYVRSDQYIRNWKRFRKKQWR